MACNYLKNNKQEEKKGKQDKKKEDNKRDKAKRNNNQNNNFKEVQTDREERCNHNNSHLCMFWHMLLHSQIHTLWKASLSNFYEHRCEVRRYISKLQ